MHQMETPMASQQLPRKTGMRHATQIECVSLFFCTVKSIVGRTSALQNKIIEGRIQYVLEAIVAWRDDMLFLLLYSRYRS